MYDNNIHILGSNESNCGIRHYVYKDFYESGDWNSVSTLPYQLENTSIVIWHNEIHILGTMWSMDYAKRHYKWDGTNWTEVSTLPYSHYGRTAVIFNDEIHILGGGYYASTTTDSGGIARQAHYKWDGTSWTEVSTLPINFSNGGCVIYNNEIHILGGTENKAYGCHYKWDGSSWIFVSYAPYPIYEANGVVYKNEIHICGGYASAMSDTQRYHYKWDGKSWSFVSTLPYYIRVSLPVIYNDKINILGTFDSSDNNNKLKHYEFTPKSMEAIVTYPPCTLSVYRREFDGDFVEIATGIKNGSNTYVIDPHPALDFARYRIVAIDNKTGAVSYNDPPGYPVGEKAIIIQWDEKWSNFDVDPGNEDALSNPPWTGSLLKLPYNIDVSDSNDTDVSLVEYIGRKHPVSYYGTQRGETASWSVDIPKHDKDTLYALRRLRVYMGDVYVREPSGSGYWARIKVSFSQTHCETVIPVSIELTRVEGGK